MTVRDFNRAVKQCVLILICMFLTGIQGPAKADDLENGGRTKFEIFGMMDEYRMTCATFDGETIEGFYSSEADAAARFKELLPAYCKEEGIGQGFISELGSNGSVIFISPIIARSIRSHYEDGGFGQGTGALKESEFANASNLDLLRYLRGVYFRNNYKEAEVILAANAPSEMRRAGAILSKMGCRGVRIYINENIPETFALFFSPTPKLRKFLGIKNTVMFDDVNKACGNRLKLSEQIGQD